MKKIILFYTIFLATIPALADLTGKLDLSCKLQFSSPNDMKATLKGPSPQGIYILKVVEGFYGYEFRNVYRLKNESALKLASSKASVSELNKNDKSYIVEIKTDKVGPTVLICQ